MFDVIGKRRWFYLFSLIITIPGLFFILLTPTTDAGLQFTIDYTGGTRWEIRFENPAVTPDQVKAVFASQGLEATAITTGSGFIEIKTEQIVGLQENDPGGDAGRHARSERVGCRVGKRGSQCQRGRERQCGPEHIGVAGPIRLGLCCTVGLAGGVIVARAVAVAIGRGDRQYPDPDPGQAR